ncbi:MAG: hypothetical protein E7301_13740 [Butyrivibrio sp.]|nr:hypothetical protein [Butyrivibrio sp.]
MRKSIARKLAGLLAIVVMTTTFASDYNSIGASASEENAIEAETLETATDAEASEESEVVEDSQEVTEEAEEVVEEVSETTEDSEEAAEAEEQTEEAAEPAEDAEETSTEGSEEVASEETPAQETPAEETPAEETPAEETPAEDAAAEETAEDVSVVNITYTAGVGGTVSIESEQVTDAAAGATATADDGYKFVNWTNEDEVIVSEDATFTPSGDQLVDGAVYYANFMKAEKEFSCEKEIDGIKITLSADKGVLPSDVELNIVKVENEVEEQITELLDEKTGDDVEVAKTYSYDITFKAESAKTEENPEGIVQPENDKTVEIKFSQIEEAASADTELAVYHVEDDLSDADIVAEATSNTATDVVVNAEHFSIYTVTITDTKNVNTIKISVVDELGKDITLPQSYDFYADSKKYDVSVSEVADKILSNVNNQVFEFVGATYKGKVFDGFYKAGKNKSLKLYNGNRNNVVADNNKLKEGDIVFTYTHATYDHLDFGFMDPEEYNYYKNNEAVITAQISDGDPITMYPTEQDADIKSYEYRAYLCKYKYGADQYAIATETIKFTIKIGDQVFEKTTTTKDNAEAAERCYTNHKKHKQEAYGFDYVFSFADDFKLKGDVVYHKNDGTDVKWSDTVKFEGNTTTQDYSVLSIDTIAKKESAPKQFNVYADHVFKGWGTKDESGKINLVYTYNNGKFTPDSCTVTKDSTLDLYAVWEEDEETVEVAVYATDGTKNTTVNAQLQSLLGLNFVQDDAYYPVGVVNLPKSLFKGTTPYIHSEADLEAVKAALGKIDTSKLINSGAQNSGNTVGEHLDCIQFDSNGVADSKKTALFDWDGEEHFDEVVKARSISGTYKYHLDLRFATNIVSYIGVYPDSTTTEAQEKAYLTGKTVTLPGASDFVLSESDEEIYSIDGYYKDKACSEEYPSGSKKIASNETIYVKLVNNTATLTVIDKVGDVATVRKDFDKKELNVGAEYAIDSLTKSATYTYGYEFAYYTDTNEVSKENPEGKITEFETATGNVYKDTTIVFVYNQVETEKVYFFLLNDELPQPDYKAQNSRDYFPGSGSKDWTGTAKNIDKCSGVKTNPENSTARDVYKAVYDWNGISQEDTQWKFDEGTKDKINSYLARKGYTADDVVWYVYKRQSDGCHIDGYLKASLVYDANGGTSTDGKTQDTTSVRYKEAVTVDASNHGFAREGYEFIGWSTDKNATTPEYAKDVTDEKIAAKQKVTTLYAVWKGVDQKAYYQVEYYYQNKKGNFNQTADEESDIREAIVNASVNDGKTLVTIEDTDKTKTEYNMIAYTLLDEKENNKWSGNVTKENTEENPLVLKVYYIREVSGITITITTNSDEKIYDGTELKNDGFTFTAVGKNTDGSDKDLKDRFTVNANVTGKIEGKGATLNTLSAFEIVDTVTGQKYVYDADKDLGETTDTVYVFRKKESAQIENAPFAVNYIIVKEGTLKVTPRKVTITVPGVEKFYDGTAYRASDYDKSKVTITAEYTAEEIAAHKNNMNLSLRLGKNAITVKNNVKTVADSRKVTDEIKLNTGKKVRGSKNGWEIQLNGKDIDKDHYDNYDLTIVNGDLVIKPVEARITIPNAEKVYNGKAFSNEEYSAFLTANGTKVGYTNLPEGLSFKDNTVKVKLPADYKDVIYDATYDVASWNKDVVTVDTTATKIVNKAGKSVKYAVVTGEETSDADLVVHVTPGSLRILRRNVTLTSKTLTKEFELGVPLTADERVKAGETDAKEITANAYKDYTVDGYVKGDGFVEGEGVNTEKTKFTGERVDIGGTDEKENTFEYVLKDNTKATNYKITSEYGDLVVTKRDPEHKYKIKIALSAQTDEAGRDTTVYYSGVEQKANMKVDVTVDTHQITDAITDSDVFAGLSGAVKNALNAAVGSIKAHAEEGFVLPDGAVLIPEHNETINDKMSVRISQLYLTGGAGTDAGDYPIFLHESNMKIELLYDGKTFDLSDEFEIEIEKDGQKVTTDDAATLAADAEDETVVEDKTDIIGYLHVLKKDVVLTSASATKVYDGTPLTAPTVTASENTEKTGFVEGEGAAYNVTGTITEPGTVSNTFTYALQENTLAANYNISTEEGTLTVTKQTEENPPEEDDKKNDKKDDKKDKKEKKESTNNAPFDDSSYDDSSNDSANSAPANNGEVLGVNREADGQGEEAAVLGARRAGTEDSTNSARVIVILIAAGVVASILAVSRKKKEDKNN